MTLSPVLTAIPTDFKSQECSCFEWKIDSTAEESHPTLVAYFSLGFYFVWNPPKSAFFRHWNKFTFYWDRATCVFFKSKCQSNLDHTPKTVSWNTAGLRLYQKALKNDCNAACLVLRLCFFDSQAKTQIWPLSLFWSQHYKLSNYQYLLLELRRKKKRAPLADVCVIRQLPVKIFT